MDRNEVDITNLKVFATRIKELRQEQGLSLRDLAARLEVSHASIGFYEDCSREPTLSVMKKFAAYFNVSTDYLMGLSDERRNADAKNKKP